MVRGPVPPPRRRARVGGDPRHRQGREPRSRPPLLPREEYEALGRKRAPAFVGERGRLHQVARRWQEHLEIGRRLDEIDLCRLALASVPPGGLYDHLVCDEAQDLAEIQMELLLRLVPGRSLGGLFLAGDPQQVINPSGFRWAEVRSRIRDRFIERGRPAPELRDPHAKLPERARPRRAGQRGHRLQARSDGPQRGRRDGAERGGGRRRRSWWPATRTALADAIRGFGPRCAVVAGSAGVSASGCRPRSAPRASSRCPRPRGSSSTSPILWGVVAGRPRAVAPAPRSGRRACARTRPRGAPSITSTWR